MPDIAYWFPWRPFVRLLSLVRISPRLETYVWLWFNVLCVAMFISSSFRSIFKILIAYINHAGDKASTGDKTKKVAHKDQESLMRPCNNETMRAMIIESCLYRINSILKAQIGKFPAEVDFMSKCGVKSLDELKLKIDIAEDDFQRAFQLKEFKTTSANDQLQKCDGNLLKTLVSCYCAKPGCNITIYFRCNTKSNQIRYSHFCSCL